MVAHSGNDVAGGNRGYPRWPFTIAGTALAHQRCGVHAARATGCTVWRRLPAGLIIGAMSGWLCFSSRILVISWVKAAGSSTNALASASSLSRTMAISISPPSFGWGPVGRLAFAQGSQLPCFHTRCAPIPPGSLCQGARLWWGILSRWCPQREDKRTMREGGGWQVCDCSYCTANVTLFYFTGRGWFAPNGRLGVSPQFPQCVSVLWFHTFPVLHCVMTPLGCFVILFLLNRFSCRILPICRRALVGLQIDECSIVGRHINV